MPRKLLDEYMAQAAKALAEHSLELGQRIKAARDEKQWKQKELAARVHVEPMTVSRWERGKNTPDLDTLSAVARELDKPLSYFVEQREVAESIEQRLTRMEEGLSGLRSEIALVLTELQEVRRMLLAAAPRPAAR